MTKLSGEFLKDIVWIQTNPKDVRDYIIEIHDELECSIDAVSWHEDYYRNLKTYNQELEQQNRKLKCEISQLSEHEIKYPI